MDAPGHAVKKGMWMKRNISEIATEYSQGTVVRYHEGDIVDDMTVFVARMDRYLSEWGSFKCLVVTRRERPKIGQLRVKCVLNYEVGECNTLICKQQDIICDLMETNKYLIVIRVINNYFVTY